MSDIRSSSAKTPFADVAGMGQPARAALAESGYGYLEQLDGVSEKELKKLHAMGPKALRVLREHLQARGLDFLQEDSSR